MVSVVHTIRGKKAYEWAVNNPEDRLYIEPVGAQTDGGPARGVRVAPLSPEVKKVLEEDPDRLACDVTDS
jgi:hypothetical protein